VRVLKNVFASSFVLKSEKPEQKRIDYCSKHMVKTEWVVQKCLTVSVELKRVEPLLKVTPCSGQPPTSRNKETIAKVRTIILNNRRLTVREIADDCATFA